MSNFPLSYKLSWLPRFLGPSLGGGRAEFAPGAANWLDPPPARTARLVFIGDISAVANRAAPDIDPPLRTLLASADLVVGNCESPVVERPHFGFGTRLGTRHAMTREFVTEALDAAGIARERLVLSVANNHALDQGIKGFEETLAALGALGIRIVGLAGEPVAKVVGPVSLSVGFMAFTRWRNARESDFAGRVAMLDPESWPCAAMQDCDLVCALPHWDWEFRHFPRAETRTLARRLAEAGAGLIVGGHAHVVQPVERFGETLVSYGLGDFLGTALARQPWPGRIGSVLVVDIGLDGDARGRIASYRCHPFFRLRDGQRERLVPVAALGGTLRDKVAGRLAAVLGDGATA